MEKISTPMLVVAVALERAGGRILMQQRPLGKAHGGLWEFPGGKVEPGESPRDALVREIKEELAVTLDSATLTPVGFADGEGQERCPPIVILLYSGRTWSGDPCAMEGGSFDWFTRAEIAALDMPPLDYVLLRQLC